jgi:hypothetical protein
LIRSEPSWLVCRNTLTDTPRSLLY